MYQYVKVSNGGKHFDPAPEFLNPRWNTVMRANNVECQQFDTFDQKRMYLEQQRDLGIEWTYKVQGYHIEDLNWFHEFYKDWDRIVLLRKNLWRAFLSYQVQSQLHWNIRTTHNRQDELVAALKPFSIDIDKMTRWYDQYKRLLDVDGIRIYLEDLTHNNLSNMFDVNIDQTINQYTIDYEPYVLNLKEVKDVFHKQGSSFYQH